MTAILTVVLLQVKTFVLYPNHYDQEVLSGEVQMLFQGFDNKVLTWQLCIYWAAVLIHTLIALKQLEKVTRKVNLNWSIFYLWYAPEKSIFSTIYFQISAFND